MIQSTTTRYEPLRHSTWSNRQWQWQYRLILVESRARLSISSRAVTFATFVPVATRVCVQFVATMLEYNHSLIIPNDFNCRKQRISMYS